MHIVRMIYLRLSGLQRIDIKVTLDHCTDGEIIKKQIKESGFPAIVGPSFGHKTKLELAHKSFKTPAVLQKEGILIAITTDSPVIPEEYLHYVRH